jgi:hypothetical protein
VSEANRVELPGVTHGLGNPDAKLRTATEGLESVFAAFEMRFTREPAEGGTTVTCMFNQIELLVWRR